MSHIHPHAKTESCHCSLCKPLERPCGCSGCLKVTADKYVCSKCETFCEVLEISHGMETTEFWGATQSNEEIETVSDCCEAELLEKSGAFDILGDSHLQLNLI